MDCYFQQQSLGNPPRQIRLKGPAVLPCRWLKWVTLTAMVIAVVLQWGTVPAHAVDVLDHMNAISRFEDRSTGTPGCEKTARYIVDSFRKAGLTSIGTQPFFQPIAELESAHIEVEGHSWPLYPWGPNMAALAKTPSTGLGGRLIYVGDGAFKNFNGLKVEGSIVLMNIESRQNWLNAAMLGARALIFIGGETSTRIEFSEKNTPTPLSFPRFWVPGATGAELIDRTSADVAATIFSDVRWKNKVVKNIYGLVQGTSPELSEEMIVLEASYDASSNILGVAPGADEATSISVLLSLADSLAKTPPARSVLFVATTGSGQGLSGMREFMWSATARRKDLSKERRYLRDLRKDLEHLRELLQSPDPLKLANQGDQKRVWAYVVERAKDAADYWSRQVQYQEALARRAKLDVDSSRRRAAPREDTIQNLENPRPYRRLSWRTAVGELGPDQKALARNLIQKGEKNLSAEIDELKERQKINRASMKVKRVARQHTPVLYLSLSLSSRALDCGLVEWGNTFPLQDRVTRQLRSYRLAEILYRTGEEVALELGGSNLIRNTSRLTQGSQNVGTPPSGFQFGSDIAAIAPAPAVTLATLDDERLPWATPNDRIENVNRKNLKTLASFLTEVLSQVSSNPKTKGSCSEAIKGLAAIRGQAMFVRQGELFADQPAPGTIISAIMGDSVFRTMVFRDGTFQLTGIANRRVAFQKVIVEPYGINPETGRVRWAADKVQTGKSNYRIKLKSRVGATALTMFHCEQTDVIGSFDPQKLGYLTKPVLLDGITEARPVRYWYSRVDGRDTMAISIMLEKGTRFKLVLSDTLYRKELLLLNSSKKRPLGIGHLIGPPDIKMAPLQVSRDMHFLLRQRLNNLTRRGIVNRYLQDLFAESDQDLNTAEAALKDRKYDQFWSHIVTAWAKLDRIYGEVEGTQRDVLTGVMFFIALFVPFAYCMERYLFCFRSIYQQMVAFLIILLGTIFTIRALHPAFQLTYNPMVVIIAFFIVGLSLLVSWIIFARFEHEMARSRVEEEPVQAGAAQVNKWQAFGAGFAIGVSNLNRRRLRTALTCVTLIILTFTVMSFTNVKSLEQTTLTHIGDRAAYRGVLIHHQIWRSLTPLTLADMATRFGDKATLWPRAWLEPRNPFDRNVAIISSAHQKIPLEGVLGVGSSPPPHLLELIRFGRWFKPGERRAILIPTALADQLGLDPEKDVGSGVRLWNEPFTIVGFFDGDRTEELTDLDGNRLTPSYLEMAADQEISEVEVDAMQSGEEITPMTERFRSARANLTVFIPYDTCIAFGGQLKAISLLTGDRSDPIKIADQLSKWFVFPLFVGDNGTWFHSASRTLRYQGVANILVPILIVIFICLNTMIGHVHERQREISVYTSVGLAPTHVGFLFIVEAMSLAVLSTVIGYILAQLSAKYLGNTALFSQLTFNYSSMASIACMFLVFSVVFLASLYPARIAARLAMPDVTRTWKLPDPEEGAITLNLPFLLKTEEETGIMHFLTAFFESHQDVAHGAFIVSGASLDYDSPFIGAEQMPVPVCMVLRADVWLAPFDFGIKQRIHLHCCPSESNPGYLEIAIRMIRLSGENSSWIRSNMNFIKSLRKQMLMWRFLDADTKARYAAGPEGLVDQSATPTSAEIRA